MSDVLPQIEPETSGRVTKLDVPIAKYLSESFKAGQDESMFRAVSNITEDKINGHPANSPTLSADDANQKYGIGNLKFTEPVNESLASMMHSREQDRMDREMYLYSGATKARFLPGMAASILGASANPLDFGSMFIPFVGAGEKVAQAGRVAKILERGLIPFEAIEKTGIPAPKLIASMAQGTAWMGMAEVPKVIESRMENQPLPSIGSDLIGQAALAAMFHGVGVGLRYLGAKTHEAMSKQAMNDFLQDKDFTAHEYIPLDEHVIAFQAMEREIQLRHEGEQTISLSKIAEEYKDKNLEYSVAAALREPINAEGQQPIHTGPTHWSIPGAEKMPEGTERGMWTNKGRFVSMEEAQKLHGLPESDYPTSEHILYGAETPDEMSPAERNVYADMLERGFTDREALNTVRSQQKERMENNFFSKPEVKADIERLRKEAIDKFVEARKAELADPVPKEVRQTATTPLVEQEHVEKYNGDEAHINKSLDDDIQSMTGEPSGLDLDKPNPDHEEYQKLVDSMKTADDKFAIAGQIEKLKNKYGGMVPPEKLPVVNAINTAIDCILKKLL